MRDNCTLGYLYLLIISVFLGGFLINLFAFVRVPPTGEDATQKLVYTGEEVQSVLHVSKEFPPASFGGVSSMLSAFTRAQIRHLPSNEVSVALPFYLFLRTKIQVQLVRNISFVFAHELLTVNVYKYINADSINVYLFSGSNEESYHKIWDISDWRAIYSPIKNFSWTQRDVFYARCVAEFVAESQNAVKLLNDPHFTPFSIVHIHGATNALVAPFTSNLLGLSRPSIVYTMHDYHVDPWYNMASDDMRKLNIWIDEGMGNVLKPEVNMAKLGVTYADVITCVSKSCRDGILNKEITNPNYQEIAQKEELGCFFGISNAMSHESFDPNGEELVKKGLALNQHPSIVSAKQHAKAYLIERKILPPSTETVVLFVGRFEEIKGVDYLRTMASLATKLKFHLVVMGYLFGNTASSVITLLKTLDSVSVIDDHAIQTQFGIMIRLSADFQFVPSLKEAFGLVLLEGQKFGAIPIVSNIPALRDLVKSDESEGWNGFSFGLEETLIQTNSNLEKVTTKALSIFREMDQVTKERLLQQLVRLPKSWDDKDGPLGLYQLCYNQAHHIKAQGYANDFELSDGLRGVEEIDHSFYSANYLLNPSFEGEFHWRKYSLGFGWTSYGKSNRGLLLKTEKLSHVAGAFQDINFPPSTELRGLYVEGWCKTQNVVLLDPNQSKFGIHVDVYHVDGSMTWGLFIGCSDGSHYWEKISRSWVPLKPIRAVQLMIKMTDCSGTAVFDDLAVQAIL